MNKNEFLEELELALRGLPKNDIDERLAFYEEMINDRIEDGESEEKIIADIGSIDKIKAQILEDVPILKLIRERARRRKNDEARNKKSRNGAAMEITLLVLGSPVWISVLISVAAVIFSLYVSLWSVVISIWSVFVSFAASALFGAVIGIINVFMGNSLLGILLIDLGVMLAGLSIFVFVGSLYASKGMILLTKKMLLGIKICFLGRRCSK
ncbi:MAG: DUF1700 domain-containing protein [Clostridia bacterium]|nr:DUF1700 domain-containing protein [Clostridia bacterium]